jgi:uncharacterized membrane protein
VPNVDEPTRERGPADETVAQKQHRLFSRGRDTGRIEYFTDAVIAIAMTLLVLDIHLPRLAHGETVFEAIGRDWEQFFAYALSFVVIALNWVFHHRRFRAIVSYDAGLVWLNLAFLLFIALVPFPTSLLADRGPDPEAIALYAGVVAILGLLGAATWAYAFRKGLLSAAIDAPLYRHILGNNLVGPIVFVLSIPVAFGLQAAGVSAVWAMWFWTLNWVGGIAWGRLHGATRVTSDDGDLASD